MTRWVYAAGVVLAGWVAGWGLFGPGQIDRAIPWLVPPLHARFLGALYLSGVAFLAAIAVSRRRSRQWVVEPMIAIWTGGLFVVLLWQWNTIGSVSPATVVWLVAYLALPIVAAIGFWRNGSWRNGSWRNGFWRNRGEPRVDPPAPMWLRVFLSANGVALVALALALSAAPGALASAWPWPVEPFVLRIYAPPLAAFGVGFLLGAGRRLDDLAILLPASTVFPVAALSVSAVHRGLFPADAVATWVWFAWFGTALVGLVAACARLPRIRRYAA